MIRNTLRATAALLLVAFGLVVAAPAASANPENPWYNETASVAVLNKTGAAGFPVSTAMAYWNAHPTGYMNYYSWNGATLYGETIELNNTNNPSRSECVYWYMTFKYVDGWPVVNRSIAYFNLAHPACWSTPRRKAHFTSMALGYHAGMRVFTPTTISVMSPDTIDTISYATRYDVDGLLAKQRRFFER